MRLLFAIFLVTVCTVSCGGGGSTAAASSSSSSSSSSSGSAPTGALPGQIDPVEGT